jgi:hypothetical protein
MANCAEGLLAPRRVQKLDYCRQTCQDISPDVR